MFNQMSILIDNRYYEINIDNGNITRYIYSSDPEDVIEGYELVGKVIQTRTEKDNENKFRQV